MLTPKAPDEEQDDIANELDDEVEVSDDELLIYIAIRAEQDQNPQPLQDEDEEF